MTPYYEDDLVTLYHGDCREVTEWLEADVLVTDPPYGVGYANWSGETVAGDADFTVAHAAIQAHGERPAVVYANHKSLPATLAALAAEHEIVRVGTWWKTNALSGGTFGNGWLADVEFFVVATASIPKRHLSAVAAGPRFVGNPNWQSRSDGFLHPTQKPTGVMAHVIAGFGGTVADPFTGSGSTLVAAKHVGRKAVGVEIEERYCEITAKRLTQDTLFGGETA